jgi:hypothetical protein
VSVEVTRSHAPRRRSAPESFEDFTSLGLDEVLRCAEAIEARPEDHAAAPVPCVNGAWRRLYRDMRRARVTTVADLKPDEVERHASKLGYGYFRTGMGGRDAFMPLPT